MEPNALLNQLDYAKPYRKDRLRVGLWVIDHPEFMPALVQYSFNPDHEKSIQALWGLEFVCRLKLKLFYSHLDSFFEYIPWEKNHSRLRVLSFICERIAIAYYKKKDVVLGSAFTDSHKKVMFECCFDWLITEQKLACKVRAMTALFYLGTEFTWIHGELKPILHENIPHQTAGYKARGKHVLEQIAKFNSKN